MKQKKKAAGPARSGSRAVMAMGVMGALVVLYGWNSFFLAPKARATSAVKKELATARQQEAELRGNLTELKKLANDSQAREAELSRLSRLIPNDADVAGAILALNETAHQAQVAWSSFVPAAPVNGATGPSISITMKVSGTFGQIFEYLRRLELLDRLVVVDGVDLKTGDVGTGSPIIDADIQGRIFAAGTAGRGGAATAAAAGQMSPSGTTALPKAGG